MENDSSPLSPTLLEAAAVSSAVLRGRQVRYALIGGLAAGLRTHARYTRDVDFLLTIPQLALPGVLEDLQQRGFDFDLMTTIREWTQEHMTVLSYRGIRIDWLKPVIPAYQHILDRATEEPWLDQPIRVATAEGLILLKLLAFRPQDQGRMANGGFSRRSSHDPASGMGRLRVMENQGPLNARPRLAKIECSESDQH